MGQLLQAAHHPLISEVIREGFCPLCEQLEDFWSDLPDSHLKRQDEHTSNQQGMLLLWTSSSGGADCSEGGRYYLPVYLVSLGITEPLLFHAQVTHFRHEFIWVDEETRAEQEREDVCPLWRRINVRLLNGADKNHPVHLSFNRVSEGPGRKKTTGDMKQTILTSG